MANTAKTIQLMDASLHPVSPMVNLESLYYETKASGDNTITRHFIYDQFPIYLSFDNKTWDSASYRQTSITHTLLNIDYNDKLVCNNGDIIVSQIKQTIIPGTIYYRLDVSNYNLSDLLYNYTPKYVFNTVTSNINSTIADINSSIADINSSIADIRQLISDLQSIQPQPYDTLKQLVTAGSLIPGQLYRLIYNPGQSVFCTGHIFDLILQAISTTEFDEDVVAVVQNQNEANNTNYFALTNFSQWKVKYCFKDSDNINSLRFPWAKSFGFAVNLSLNINIKIIYQIGENLNIKYYTNNEPISTTLGDLLHQINEIRIGSYILQLLETTQDNISIEDYAFETNLDACGIIYYMKDEFGNEAPYDFKNALIYNASSYNFEYTFGHVEQNNIKIDDTINGDACYNTILSNSLSCCMTGGNEKYNQIGYENEYVILSGLNNIIKNNNSSLNVAISNGYIGSNNSSINIQGDNIFLTNNNSSILSQQRCNYITIDNCQNVLYDYTHSLTLYNSSDINITGGSELIIKNSQDIQNAYNCNIIENCNNINLQASNCIFQNVHNGSMQRYNISDVYYSGNTFFANAYITQS